ncbi:MAG TPA: threonine aldolase, partial [Clostridia bacterium]|nr:threonine aldolase [Clostridia bacterium]
MISFENDYSEGAHPRILRRLEENNLVQQTGYGKDEICEQAEALLRETLERPDVDIHFLMAG